MNNKLYTVFTKGGYPLFDAVPLELLQHKLELTLNDLMQAENLQHQQFLDRKVRIAIDEGIYQYLYSKRNKDQYLLEIQRVQ